MDHDLNNLFSRFDKKQNGYMSFEDFVCEILPNHLFEKLKNNSEVFPHHRYNQEAVR